MPPVAAAERACRRSRQVAPGIRVLALRTPTLPPAAHTNVYLVGPDAGPQVAGRSRQSPYPDQQAVARRACSPPSRAAARSRWSLLTHHHGDHVGGAAALAGALGVPIAAHAATARRLARACRGHARARATATRVARRSTRVFTPGHADGHLCFDARRRDDRGRHGRRARHDPDRSERGRHGALPRVARAPARARRDAHAAARRTVRRSPMAHGEAARVHRAPR